MARSLLVLTTVSMVSVVSLAGCTGPDDDAPKGHVTASGPAAELLVDRTLTPRQQASQMTDALDAGQSVSGVPVARGFRLAWDIKGLSPSATNVYPHAHVVQPFVFRPHIYGFIVNAAEGSFGGWKDRNNISVRVLRTCLPLTPMHVGGRPVDHPVVEPMTVHLVKGKDVSGKVEVEADAADEQLQHLGVVGAQRSNAHRPLAQGNSC